MPQHVMLVLSNAKDGREAEFNEWYDVHMRETIDKLDGFAAAQRFELAPYDGAPTPYRYLAVYEIEDDRIATAYEQFLYGRQERAEAKEAGREPMIAVSDSLDPAAFLVGFYSAMGAEVPSQRLAAQ